MEDIAETKKVVVGETPEKAETPLSLLQNGSADMTMVRC